MRAARAPTHCPDGPPGERGAGLAAVVTAVLGFSWGFILVKVIPLAPAALAAWRLGLGAVGLGAVALAWRLPWPRLRGAMLLAGAAFGAHQLLFVTATRLTSVAVVTLLMSLQPLVVALLSRRTVGERVPPALVGWSLVGIAGVALTLLATSGDAVRSPVGDLLAVANLAAFTAYFLAAKRTRAGGVPTLTFTATFLGVALVVVAPMAALEGPSALAVDASAVALLALLAFGPGSGHLLLNWAHPRVSAALASLALATVPALASLWAHLVLGEPLGVWHGLGLALVVVALAGGQRVERAATGDARPGWRPTAPWASRAHRRLPRGWGGQRSR